MSGFHHRVRLDAGMVSTELAVCVPVVLFAFVALVMAGGRLVQAEGEVTSAAQEAARAATLHRSIGPARSAAGSIARANLEQSGTTCRAGGPEIDVAVDVPSGLMENGAIVTVTVTCIADLGDITRIGLPGSMEFRAQGREIIDEFRSSP